MSSYGIIIGELAALILSIVGSVFAIGRWVGHVTTELHVLKDDVVDVRNRDVQEIWTQIDDHRDEIVKVGNRTSRLEAWKDSHNNRHST